MRKDIKHIIDRLKSECGFNNISTENDSYYKLIQCSNGCNVEVRISNHKTDLNTWRNRQYGYGKTPHIRISIVFKEDNFENVVQLHVPIRKPFIVTETVYDLRNEDSHLNDEQIDSIRDVIRGIANSQKFEDPLGIAEAPVNLQSQNPTMEQSQLKHNNQLQKENRNMNKKRLKLTESDLHRLIKESVKRVLRENQFHRAYKLGKRLDGVGSIDTYTDNEVFAQLEVLKEKLRQAEERAKTGFYDEGEARNYLAGAIRGLQAFIDSHY